MSSRQSVIEQVDSYTKEYGHEPTHIVFGDDFVARFAERGFGDPRCKTFDEFKTMFPKHILGIPVIYDAIIIK